MNYTFILKKKNEKKIFLIDKPGNYQIKLTAPGAQVDIIGFFVGRNKDRFLVNTQQIHLAPNTHSNLLFKSVLFDQSVFHYQGLIKINKEAQMADAYQRNENLLVSDQAKVKSQPELEILANNVRCTHGVTVGRVNQEEIFYLNSRGINLKQAQRMLIEGFLRSLVDKVGQKSVKMFLLTKIKNKLYV